MFADPRDIIDIYTRGDLLRDGGLVDVTATAREAGFTVPVALTAAVWADCVAWTDDDNERKGTIQDEDGRLYDVVWMAAETVRRRGRFGAFVTFQVLRVPREGQERDATLVTLEMTIGPGDDGEPVITIATPGED